MASATQAPSRIPPSAGDRRIPAIVGGEHLGGIAHCGVDPAAEREPHAFVAAGGGEPIGGPAEPERIRICGASGLAGSGR